MTTAASQTTHQRVVAAAAELTLEVGWAGVTMGKLADRVGVSRQTVYNEVGSKPQLAEQMVLAELAKFLAVVDEAFDEQPGDLVEAIRGASRGVLELARGNALLQAVISASYGAETELLPLLTTRNDALVLTATQAVRTRVTARARSPARASPATGPARSSPSWPSAQPTSCRAPAANRRCSASRAPSTARSRRSVRCSFAAR